MDAKNSSIIALVCGILGVIGTFFGGLIPVITFICFACAIAGIVFGAIGMKKSKAEEGKASGLAIAGLICGIVGTVFGFAGVCCAICLCVTSAALENAANQIASAAQNIDTSNLDEALNNFADSVSNGIADALNDAANSLRQ